MRGKRIFACFTVHEIISLTSAYRSKDIHKNIKTVKNEDTGCGLESG